MMLGVGSALAIAVVAMVAVVAVSALAARRALVLITVSGGSMSPTYVDGEKLLVRRGGLRRPRVDDVVVFRHPQLARAAARAESAAAAAGTAVAAVQTAVAPVAEVTRPDVDWMVKRIVAVPGDRIPADFRHAVGAVGAVEPDTTVPPGCLLVLGDNPRSLDSRQFGYVPAADVLGVALRHRPR
jgi:signal peptidase I